MAEQQNSRSEPAAGGVRGPHAAGSDPGSAALLLRDPAAPAPDLDIVDLRPHYVVVNKPSGLCSVPGLSPDAQDCVLYRVAEMLPEASGPMICHRLDMQTSGLMVLALGAQTHRELSAQFEFRRVEKAYEALVAGSPPEPGGAVELPMRSDAHHRLLQVVDRVQGKPARTEYELAGEELVRGVRCARLRLDPITGRTHQLRLHCAHPWEDGGLGCPILGDNLYADEPALSLAPHLLLHARRLAFTDPESGEWVSYDAVPPF